MSLPGSYLGVILIWSTTPLAIRWSGDGPGFLFGVTGRMSVGLAIALPLLLLIGPGLRLDGPALRSYAASAVGMFGSMSLVYWSAQYIPSGWLSVVFGLTPILTEVMARRWLDAECLALGRRLGLWLGVAGLALIFGGSLEMGRSAALALAGVLAAVVLHCASAVWVKRIDARLPGLTQAAGGLLVATPLFLLSWLLFDGHWPAELAPRSVYSILYLGLFGSVIGFALYYYVLREVDAVRVALINLVTPVISLMLGHLLNGEALTMEVLAGTGLILIGIGIFQFTELPAPLRRFCWPGLKP